MSISVLQKLAQGEGNYSVFTMGLPIGHHVWSQMGLSCSLHPLMSTSEVCNSKPTSQMQTTKTLTILKSIYNISIRQRLRNRGDWRVKVALGGAEVSSTRLFHTTVWRQAATSNAAVIEAIQSLGARMAPRNCGNSNGSYRDRSS